MASYPLLRRGRLTTIFLFALLLIQAASAASPWGVNAAVDFPADSECYLQSFTFDEDGSPHVCYLIITPDSTGINYSWRDGESWQSEAFPIRYDELRYWSRPVHDSQGSPHLVCSFKDNNSLVYIHREEAGWVAETFTVGQGEDKAPRERPLLALGPEGAPYIAYPGWDGYLYCTVRNGTAWETETVDTGVWNAYSMVTDSEGNPGICYFNSQNGLIYAQRGEMGWNTTLIGTGSIYNAALLFDSQDRPGICYIRITYSDTKTGELLYARPEEGEWQTVVVAPRIDYSIDPSFLFDKQDRPLIRYVYSDNMIQGLYLAWPEAGQWQSSVIETGGMMIYSLTPLVLDGQGRPQICYNKGEDLQYARYDGTAWQTITIATAWDGFLAADRDGNPGITYYDETNTALMYAEPQNGISTDFSATPPAGPAPLTVQFADESFTPPAGTPLVAWDWDFGDGSNGNGDEVWHTYENPGTYTVGLTVRDENGQTETARKVDLISVMAVEPLQNWTFDDVDRGENGTGSPCSLVVDGQGRPRLSFQKVSSSPTFETAVMYAVLNRSAWEMQSLTNRTKYFSGISLALDGNDMAGVSYGIPEGSEAGLYYYDVGGGTEYGIGRGTIWEVSSTMDSTGSPCIAYTTDLEGGWGTGVYYQAESWIKVVEEPGIAGGISLALDPDGRPHLSYGGAAEGLVHAWLPAGAESFEMRNVEKELAVNTSLAIDSGGNPHIAYLVASSEGVDLKYACFDGTNWTITDLGPAEEGGGVSLALDSGDKPHISYFAEQKGLAHLWHDGAQWSQMILDEQYGEGGFASINLALDMDDVAHICYGVRNTSTMTGTLCYAVNLPLAANFAANATTGVAPLTVRFNDTSTGFPDAWEWDFGDDTSSSTDQNPVHEYAEPGWYTVNLTMQNRESTDTRTKTEYISVFQAGHFYPFPLDGVSAGSGQTVTINRTTLAGSLNVSGNTATIEGPAPSFAGANFVFSSLNQTGGNVTGDLTYVLMNSVPVTITLPWGGTALVAVEANCSSYDSAASFDLLVAGGCSRSDHTTFSGVASAEGTPLSDLLLTLRVEHTVPGLNGAVITLTLPVEWVDAYGHENIRLFRRDDTGNVTILPTVFVSENATHAVFRAWTPGFSTFTAGAITPVAPTPTPSGGGDSGSSSPGALQTESPDTPVDTPAIPDAGAGVAEADVTPVETAPEPPGEEPLGADQPDPSPSALEALAGTANAALSGIAGAVQEGGARAAGAVASAKGAVPAGAVLPEGMEPIGAIATGFAAAALVATASVAASSSILGQIADALRDLAGKLAEFFGEHIAEMVGEKEADIAVEKLGGATGGREAFWLGHREILVLGTGAVIYGLAFTLAERIGVVPGVIGMYVLVCGVVVSIHEATHYLIARRFAMPSRIRFNASGIVTTFLTAWLFGNVFAQPLMTTIPAGDKRATGIAMIAGPLVSFAFAAGFALLIPLGGIWTLMGTTGLSVNLLEAVYSLVPFTPMDGNSVYGWNRAIWAVAFVPVFIVYLALYLM